jgi:hypothetical protein
MKDAKGFLPRAGGVSDAQLDAASNERLADAEALLKEGRYASAIAMGIYALEIRLKVIICRKLEVATLPSHFEIHDLDALITLTGLSGKVTRVKRPRGVLRNWDELRVMSRKLEDLRYVPDPKTWDRAKAEKVLSQLRDPPDGVLLWLSKQS